MDRIIIQLIVQGQIDNTIFLQTSSLAPSDIKPIKLADQSQAFQDAFAAFVALCSPLAPQVPEEHFDVIQAISSHPSDATVTRTVSANIPVRAINNVKELHMPVIVRHYRDGAAIASEFPDIGDVLIASNDNKREVNGVEVGEFDYFDNLADQYPIKQIMRIQIMEEDGQGRWNP